MVGEVSSQEESLQEVQLCQAQQCKAGRLAALRRYSVLFCSYLCLLALLYVTVHAHGLNIYPHASNGLLFLFSSATNTRLAVGHSVYVATYSCPTQDALGTTACSADSIVSRLRDTVAPLTKQITAILKAQLPASVWFAAPVSECETKPLHLLAPLSSLNSPRLSAARHRCLYTDTLTADSPSLSHPFSCRMASLMRTGLPASR